MTNPTEDPVEVHACSFCGYEYPKLTPETEIPHLQQCDVFLTVPVACWIGGRPFVRVPGNDGLFVERVRIN